MTVIRPRWSQVSQAPLRADLWLIWPSACLLLLVGCATTALEPIAGWDRPLCAQAKAVTSPWDSEIREVWARLWPIVAVEAGRRDVTAVVVEGGHLAAWTCGDTSAATIAIPAATLRSIQTWAGRRDTKAMIGQLVAHELAHVVLHQNAPARSIDLVTREYEADELGAYYFERAGFNCRVWVEGIGLWKRGGYASDADQREAVGRACDLAKQGQRPPRRAVQLGENPKRGPSSRPNPLRLEPGEAPIQERRAPCPVGEYWRSGEGCRRIGEP